MTSHILNMRQLYDLEMIMNGGFYPLKGFLNKGDYDSVIDNMRLLNGKVWPIPITLDVDNEFKNKISITDKILLKDQMNNEIAYLIVETLYLPDKKEEALKVFGTTDVLHPGVDYLLNQSKEWYIGGKIIKIKSPYHVDFINLRKTPEDLKKYFIENGMTKIIGFQTRNPMHKSHYTITRMALNKYPNSHLLIHPSVGITNPGDIDYHTRTKCYELLLPRYEGRATLSLLPLAMRMGGPREALWHAIIRKNYGCTHFIVGRDHSGPGKNKNGIDFYDPYAAQELCKKYSKEIGIKIITFNSIVYVKELDNYYEIDKINPSEYTILNISGTQLRAKLKSKDKIPEWFAFPEIVKLLQINSGTAILLTGLSGAGKSTISNHLKDRLLEKTNKQITILDGDEVRTHLSKGLGFSKEDRDTNIKRIAYVSSLIVKNGGIVIVPCISPYAETRKYFRELCEKEGDFYEIYVSTPLEKCEERDVKGLYKKVKLGEIKNFTGIDDPYEIPISPDITIDTSQYNIYETIDIIMKNIIV